MKQEQSEMLSPPILFHLISVCIQLKIKEGMIEHLECERVGIAFIQYTQEQGGFEVGRLG